MWAAQLRYSNFERGLTEPADPTAVSEAAAQLEALGYTALWVPDIGGPVFDAVDHLLRATDNVVVATGILNLWMHSPDETAAAYAALTAEHGDRFLVGIGVSHEPLIDELDPGRYRKPLSAMAAFLDGLDAAEPPLPAGRRVLAALGPKMIDLAAHRSQGVHPYLVTPEHTALARDSLGPDSLVLPEQTVVLCSTADEAREIAERWLHSYLALPNYANSLLRLGFSEADVVSVSDRVFDALIAWGDEDVIKSRVDRHLAAGADHVCVQVLTADPTALPIEQWRRLAAVLN